MEINTEIPSTSDLVDLLPVHSTQDALTPKTNGLTGFAKVWDIVWNIKKLGAIRAPAGKLSNPQIGGIVALVMLVSVVFAAGFILPYTKNTVGLLLLLMANTLVIPLNCIKVPGYSLTAGLIMGIITYFVTRKQVEYPFGKPG